MNTQRAMRSACLVLWCALHWCGCGGAQSDGDPLVIVGTGDAGAEAGGGTIESSVSRDSALAVEVLADAIREGEGGIRGWAAVYVLRLGVVHDEQQTRAALIAGTRDDDALLAALCWRWLAADPAAELPRWPKGERPEEPVVGVMAALAFSMRRGKLPKPLRDALGLPEGVPDGSEGLPPGLVERLKFLAGPFDNGPLALAVAFVDARREGWSEGLAGGGDRWVAERLRKELYRALGGEGDLPAPVLESKPPEDPRYSDLGQRLDSPLVSRPPEVLRGAVMAAKGRLRVNAIRALAVASSEPAAGDLGAVAAAMRSPDRLVRVEAARTFLVLAALATEDDRTTP